MPIQAANLLIPGASFAEVMGSGPAPAGLLAAWTALWQPELLAATGLTPGTHSVFELPPAETVGHELLAVPHGLPTSLEGPQALEWLAAVKQGVNLEVVVLEGFACRAEIIPELLRRLEMPAKVPPELAAEFYALGFALAQVEALCRELATGGVDRVKFNVAAVAAARHAVAGEADMAQDQLQVCHDLLATARNHAYGVELHIVDVLLSTEDLSGEPLQQELSQRTTNLLIRGGELQQLAAQHPATAAELRAAVERESVSLLTSGFDDVRLSDLSPEDLAEQITRCRTVVAEVTGHEPTCYGSFTGDFPERAPQQLSDLRYAGALLTSFTGQSVTRGASGKVSWTGSGSSDVQGLAKTPLDAGAEETFAKWAPHLARALETESPATLLLASWPGHAHEHHADLQLAARRGDALGKFITLEKYFGQTPPSYSHCKVVAPGDLLTSTAKPQAAVRWRERLTAGLLEFGQVSPSASSTEGTMAINPWGFSAQAVSADKIGRRLMKKAPAFGAVRIAAENYAASSIVTGDRIANSTVEAVLDPQRGTLRSLRLLTARRPALSQRLVLRAPIAQVGVSRNPVTRYEELDSHCAAWEQTHDAWGGQALRATGTIGPAERKLGAFTQTISLVPGRPWAVVTVTWKLAEPLVGDPAETSLAYRLAWGDSAEILVGRQAQNHAVGKSFRSGDFVHLADASPQITLVPWGAVAHHRRGENQLDTPLTTGTSLEGSQQFAVLLGCDYPWPAVLELSANLAGEPALAFAPAAPLDATPIDGAWWLHLSAPNLLVTRIETDNQQLRLRIVETEGRYTTAKLRGFRPFTTAMRLDLAGQPYCSLHVNGGVVEIEASPHDWFEAAVSW